MKEGSFLSLCSQSKRWRTLASFANFQEIWHKGTAPGYWIIGSLSRLRYLGNRRKKSGMYTGTGYATTRRATFVYVTIDNIIGTIIIYDVTHEHHFLLADIVSQGTPTDKDETIDNSYSMVKHCLCCLSVCLSIFYLCMPVCWVVFFIVNNSLLVWPFKTVVHPILQLANYFLILINDWKLAITKLEHPEEELHSLKQKTIFFHWYDR